MSDYPQNNKDDVSKVALGTFFIMMIDKRPFIYEQGHGITTTVELLQTSSLESGKFTEYIGSTVVETGTVNGLCSVISEDQTKDNAKIDYKYLRELAIAGEPVSFEIIPVHQSEEDQYYEGLRFIGREMHEGKIVISSVSKNNPFDAISSYNMSFSVSGEMVVRDCEALADFTLDFNDDYLIEDDE